jgi:hypothetical protein
MKLFFNIKKQFHLRSWVVPNKIIMWTVLVTIYYYARVKNLCWDHFHPFIHMAATCPIVGALYISFDQQISSYCEQLCGLASLAECAYTPECEAVYSTLSSKKKTLYSTLVLKSFDCEFVPFGALSRGKKKQLISCVYLPVYAKSLYNTLKWLLLYKINKLLVPSLVKKWRM